MSDISKIKYSISFEDKVNGKREPYQAGILSVTYGAHEGNATLVVIESAGSRILGWPDEGLEWNICPSEWEYIEDAVRDDLLDKLSPDDIKNDIETLSTEINMKVIK